MLKIFIYKRLNLLKLETLLTRLDKEIKLKAGVENMLEVYVKDKKRTKELETQLEECNEAINKTTKAIENIRRNAGNFIVLFLIFKYNTALIIKETILLKSQRYSKRINLLDMGFLLRHLA